MKKNTKIIIGVTAGVALLGTIGYFIYRSKSKKQQQMMDSRAGEGEFDDYMVEESSGDPRWETPVNPRLSFITNKKAASYLSGKLSDAEIIKLKGWMDLIKREKAKDPSKWGDANGLTGQVSQLAGALYQMQTGNQCDNCWNEEFLVDLRDTQR